MALAWQDAGRRSGDVDTEVLQPVCLRGIKEALAWVEMARSLCLYDAFTAVGAEVGWNGRRIFFASIKVYSGELLAPGRGLKELLLLVS